MQKLQADAGGQRVAVRGEAWLVVQREVFDACTLVTLRGAGGGNLGETATLLTPFDRICEARVAARLARARRRTVLRRAARAVSTSHRWRDLWTAASARIDLLPWQLEPAFAVVSGATRVLLADEVGLGKTIQAGLILTELRARGLMSRALILTPASLRSQWASEIQDRFGIEPVVLDHVSLAQLASALPVGVNPWSTADLIVSSIDLVKRPEVRAAVDGALFDALVIDEAHHLKPGTDRGALAADLAARIPWVVLATATPHSGDEHAYAFLRGLGAVGSVDPIVVFRRSAEQVGCARMRRARYFAIDPTPQERLLLDETLAYARAVWQRRGEGSRHAALVASVMCRRAASSAAALVRTLERRRALLHSARSVIPEQGSLPWHEGEDEDDVEADDVLGDAALTDRPRELEWLDRLIELAKQVEPASSKTATIERVMRSTTESAIVFSEYRDTIARLEERLGHYSTAVLHGGLSARERREAIQRFVGGEARVLLATDAAGEGLNLQARCRLVINVELPWNPMRLEQRAGRVDRLGQTRRVHALHLFHRGSFEDHVLASLGRRVQRAARELQEVRVDACSVAAAVFEGESLPESGAPLHVNRPDARGEALASDATIRRRAAAVATSSANPPGSERAVCASPLRRHALVSRFVLLFEWDLHDGCGRLASRELCPLAVELPSRRVHPAAVRDLVEQLSSAGEVRDALTREMALRVHAAAHELRDTAAALDRRLRALIDALSSSLPPPLQGSLFDRRAEQRSRANDAARAALQQHLRHRLTSVQALDETSWTACPRLVAAWPTLTGG